MSSAEQVVREMACGHKSCLLIRAVLAVEYLKASMSHTEHTCSGYMNTFRRRAKEMSVICVLSMSRMVASFSMPCTMPDGLSVLHSTVASVHQAWLSTFQ